MESVLFSYSEFFNDDGGFDRIKRDFMRLGDELAEEATRIKKRVNDSFNSGDMNALEQQEKQVDNLSRAFQDFEKTQTSINKIQQEFQKQQKRGTATTEDQLHALVRLDKELNTYRTELKRSNALEKAGVDTGEDLNKTRVEAQLNIRRTQREIRRLQREFIQQNELSRDEQKLLRAKLVLENREIQNINDIRERLSALRVVRNATNIITEEGARAVAELNMEIDDLDELLKSNSDQFTQNKINIGNYEESIVSALNNNELFRTNIGALDGVLSSLVGILILNREQLDQMAKSSDANTNAVKRLAIAFGRLNTVLRASIIGVVVLAISALGNAFGNTVAGSVRLQKTMAGLSSAFTSFTEIAAAIFTGDFGEIANIIENAGEAFDRALKNIDRELEIQNDIREANIELERLNGELEITQNLADDSTQSLNNQLQANARALRLTQDIGETNVSIARQELDLANEKVRTNILLNTEEVKNVKLNKQGVEFAQSILDLAKSRGTELEISNDLIEEQQQAVLRLNQAENTLASNRIQNIRLEREIQRDIFEQNLDLLIDLTDNQRRVAESSINDITRNLKTQQVALNNFIRQFGSNAIDSISEFNNLATQSAEILRRELENSEDLPSELIQKFRDDIMQLENIDLDIQFLEDGAFEIFNNGTRLTLDNIVELNSQLQELGFAQIPINRLRELLMFVSTGIVDLRNFQTGLTDVSKEIENLLALTLINDAESGTLNSLAEQIEELRVQSLGASPSERAEILKNIEELERQKTFITEGAERERLLLRRENLLEELNLTEEGSLRRAQILNDLSGIERQIAEEDLDFVTDNLQKRNQEAIEQFEKFAENVRRIAGLALDELVRINQQRIEDSQQRVDRQEEQVDSQEERARQGLQNTLAFEQRALAEREAELIAQQRRQERLEQVRALYATYSNFASQGEEDPIGKTLRDFAILRALAASFEDGGIVGIDGLRTNSRGITRGRSHNLKGGSLAYHQNGEGFFSRKEVQNMGVDNFYKIKRLASNGPLSGNFFTGQKESFIAKVPERNFVDSSKVLNDIKQAIENKPVPSFNAPEVVDGVLRLVETEQSKHKTKRTTYIVRKSGL